MIDSNIVTGRVPDDVPEFVDAITDALEAATAAPASSRQTQLPHTRMQVPGGSLLLTDPNCRLAEWS